MGNFCLIGSPAEASLPIKGATLECEEICNAKTASSMREQETLPRQTKRIEIGVVEG